MAVTALLALATAAAVPITSAHAGTPWQPTGRLSLGAGGAVSCAGAGSCWAVSGGELLQSDTNGASWVDRSARVPLSVDVLDTLECPAVATCYVAGRTPEQNTVVLRLTPTGDSVVPVATPQGIASISCLSAVRCLAVDRVTAFETTDGGLSWSPLAPPTDLRPRAVSCVRGTRTCFVVGGGYQDARVARTDNAGQSWHEQNGTSSTSSWLDVSCPTSEDCVAVGQDGFYGTAMTTHDGGDTWLLANLPNGTNPLYFASCARASTCEISGGPGAGFGTLSVLGTTDGGTTWTTQNFGSFAIGAFVGSAALACTSTANCAAVTRGGLGFTTTTGGATWTSSALPAAIQNISRMTCPSRTFCVALGYNSLLRRLSLTSTDGGVTWHAQTLRWSSGYVASLDCPTTTTCLALTVTSTFDGQRTTVVGQVLATTNGAVTWHAISTAETKNLRGMSCASATTCVGFGEVRKRVVMYASVDGGATWQSRPAPAGVSAVTAISCSTDTACVLLATPTGGTYATQAEVTTDQAMTYTPVDLVSSAVGYRLLECIAMTCFAGGTDAQFHGVVLASSDGGLNWVDKPMPAEATRLQQIDCSSARVCAIGGADNGGNGDGAEIIGTTDGGAHWRIHKLPLTEVSYPTAVACGGATCLSADYGYSSTPRILAGAP